MATAAEMMGAPLFPWQRYVVDVALEVDDAGVFVYDEILITVPRQSGKTFLIGPVTMQRCMTNLANVWMTAQKGKAKDRWLAAVKQMLATPIRPHVKFTHGVGNECLEWLASGSTFKPFNPTATAMHGESPDLVLVDELWTFNALQQQEIEESYQPAWSVKQGQAWLMSTAGTEQSEWLNRARRRARRAVEDDRRDGTALFEWSAPERVDGKPLPELDDDTLLKVVIDAHPRRDHGLSPVVLRKQLERRPRERWIRDYGNVTQADEDTLGVFTAREMGRARSGTPIREDARIALGVSVDPDRRDAAIGIAVRDEVAGVAFTQERREVGVRWVAPMIIRLVDQYDVSTVAVAGSGPARSVADELERAGVPLLQVTPADHAAACAGFSDGFVGERPSVTWDGSPEFAKAVAAAQVRRRSGGFVYESRTGASVVALDARTLAVWAADHAPEPVRQLEPEIW